jgi:gamma-glutamyltranspeptidase
MMALRDGKLVDALGLPGGKRIFPSAMQAPINLIDHGMSLQQAVEAPRLWTEGNALEVEPALPEAARERLACDGTRCRRDGDRCRRHERGPVPRGRHHVRRRLLARRRHAGCDIRWTGAGRRAVRIEIGKRRDQSDDPHCRSAFSISRC